MVAAALVIAFFASATHSAFARALGIDVSHFQGTINWTSVRGDGYVFAWSKATEGAPGQYVSQPEFASNEVNGKAAGLVMGAYHYAHPEQNSPSAEANYFWSVAGAYILADGKTLMPMLDIEGSALPNGHVGAASLSDWVNTWCADVVQLAANNGVSVTPCIYVSAGTGACDLDNSVGQWFADIANYGSCNGCNDPQTGTPWSCCTGCEHWGAGGWDFWQYESVGTVSGISGNVDHDVLNGTSLTSVTATATTNSTIYYWDPQGTAGSNPYSNSMTGTWEQSKWSYGSAGLATPVAWTEGKAACFGVHTGIGTPAYTITMNSSHVVAGFFDGPLTPNSCDVTIQGSGTITLASGPQGLDSLNASDGSLGLLRINVNIAGDGQLYPEGNGQSFLHGTNSYTGGTTLGYSTVNFSGKVNFNNGFAFGTGPITLWNHGNNGSLVLEGTDPVTVTNDFIASAGATNINIVGNAAGLTLSGDWTLGTNYLILGAGTSSANQTILSGAIDGTVGITFYNSGKIVLTGTNTYTGATTINSPANVTIDGSGTLNSGSYANSLVNNGTFNYNSTASQTLSGTISGTGALKVGDVGILTLTHANTFTNAVTVSGGGTLCVTADSALGYASNNLTLNNGCLKNNNSSPIIGSARTITLSTGSGYLDAGWAPSHPLTIGAKLTGSGKLLINLDGSPVVLNNTANNYTGNTIIGTNGPGYYSAGTQAWLKLGASGVIPNGATFGNVIINQAWAGMLDLNGFSQTINGLSGDGIVDNTAGNGSLSVGNNNQTSAFNGIIQDSVGALALTKVGTGTLTLGGSNTYSGSTTISAGTLALSATGSINSTPSLTISPAATFDVSAIPAFVLSSATALQASGTATPCTLKGGTTVDFGSTPIVLTYDGSHPALTVSQGDLSLTANPFTINGSPLPVGVYTIIQLAGGNVSANGPFAITGAAIPSGKTAAIFASGGNLNLVISEPSSFSNLTPSQSIVYGASAIVLSGQVSGAGPIYPAIGEPVTVTINGSSQTNFISDGTGDFTINYNPSTIPASATPYTITYAYYGDISLHPSTDATTTLTVTPAGSSTALNSSQNPSSQSSNVTFTAVVTSSNGAPIGSVVFLTNGVPCATNPISAGVASFSTADLPVGTNTVAAQFAAQGNYLGSSDSLNQVVNAVAVPTNIVLSITNNGDGTFNLSFQGAPATSYYILTTTNVSDDVSTWIPVPDSTNTSGQDGSWSFAVSNAAPAFYRAMSVPSP